MNLVFGEPVAQWVRDRMPAYYIPDCTAIGLAENTELKCGVVYYNQRGHDVEMTIYAETARWANRGNIRAFLHYPFIQLGCERVTAIVDEENVTCQRFLVGIGFIHEGTHPKAMPNKNTAYSYGMLKEDCRWLKPLGKSYH